MYVYVCTGGRPYRAPLEEIHHWAVCIYTCSYVYMILQVSFAKVPYKRDYILQKRPIILRSLLIEATPYIYVPLLQHTTTAHCCITLQQHTTAAHYCSTLLQHTLLTKSQHYIYEPPQLPFEICCHIYELPNLRNEKDL